MNLGNRKVGKRYGNIPYIESDGVMEVGNCLDFHKTDGDQDYDVRVSADTMKALINMQGLDYSGNLDSLLRSGEGMSLRMTQKASSNPQAGQMSFTLTMSINNNWGTQWLFSNGGYIYYRALADGVISLWRKLV